MSYEKLIAFLRMNGELADLRAQAADAITTLQAELAAAREERSSWRRTAERCETEKQAAEACVKELREAAKDVIDAWPRADGHISLAIKALRALVEKKA